MLALDSFHTIGMNDIDQNLKGPAIGEALRQCRIEHLQTQTA
jgi:tRNA nucleotidyltransferase (CCA-adding enzyme)